MKTKQRWQQAWQQQAFKNRLLLGLVLLVPTLAALPFFFNAIELREGFAFHDALLQIIPPINLSTPIFLVIWATAAVGLVTSIQQPKVLLLLLWSFWLLTISRVITISLVPLNPPSGLIALIDPLSNTFYGGGFITKDLFYSGHTSTMFLLFLCMQKSWQKLVAIVATILVGIMVLIQHVHYTLDVVAAPLFTVGIFWLGKKIVSPALKSLS